MEHVRLGAGLPPMSWNCPRVSARSSLSSRRSFSASSQICRLERPDPLVAVGDDVLLEATTFAAAVYLRGVPLVTVP